MSRIAKMPETNSPNGGGLVPYRAPRLALGEEGKMRLSPAFLKLAVFLCEDRGSGVDRRRVPAGTAFFMNVEATSGLSFDYLVTARHCIDQCESDTLWVRVNKKDQSGIMEFGTKRDDWLSHPEADVAILSSPIPVPTVANELDYIPISHKNVVGPGPDYKNGPEGDAVSVGDELFAVGLFVQHAGEKRNLPVARFGHIARMPDKIAIEYDNYGNTMESVAYLAEFLSWGGLSGAPVFWLSPVFIRYFANFPEHRSVAKYLLGLVSGHFFISEKAKVRGDVLGEIHTNINSGLAIITPAEAITQLLMDPELVREREERTRLYQREQAQRVQLDEQSRDD